MIRTIFFLWILSIAYCKASTITKYCNIQSSDHINEDTLNNDVFNSPKLFIGLKCGVAQTGSAYVINTSIANENKHLGYIFGLGFQMAIKKPFIFGVEFEYITQSIEFVYNNTSTVINNEENFQWISIPISLMYQKSISRFDFNIKTGLSIDYLINSSYTHKVNHKLNESFLNNYVTVTHIENSSYNYRKKLNSSLIVGFGTEYRFLSQKKVFFLISYKLGIISIKNNNNTFYKDFTSGIQYSVQNDFSLRSIAFQVGVKMPLGNY